MRGSVNKNALWTTIAIILSIALAMLFLSFVHEKDAALSTIEEGKPMLFGVHEQYQAGPNRTTPVGTRERYPLLDVTREFKAGVITPQNLIPSLKYLCQATWDAELTCIVSFKFDKENVFNGKWQPHIVQAMNWLKDNGHASDTIVVIWHEPEDDASDSFRDGRSKTFSDGAEFVRYFNIVHDWIKSVDPLIKTSHAALGYGYRPKVGGPGDKSAWVAEPEQWRTKADIDSIDIYSGRSFPLDMTLGTSPAFKRWFDSRESNKEWGVSERGWIADAGKSADRAKSIDAEFEWIASLPIDALPYFYVVWTTEGTENDPKIILDDAGIEAVNRGFGHIQARIDESTLPPVQPPPSMMTCPLCSGSGEVPTGATYTVRVDR